MSPSSKPDDPARAGLDALRARILSVARAEGVEIVEEVKWGQPSFRAPHGSPLRIGTPKAGGFAIYAHCATRLIADYGRLSPMARIEGNRAVHFRDLAELEAQPIDALIRAALHYHAPSARRARADRPGA